ncbi:MAG: hypothetical protein IJ863_01905 [Spirochaetales bacterium]|nr:hypothetical protein [Spirochaetales bacterium]
MRKSVCLLVFVLMPLALCFSAVKDKQQSGHRVSGYINAVYIDDGVPQVELTTYLGVSPNPILEEMDGSFKGINLDYTDSNNIYRNFISPTAASCTTPGLQIGTFSALVTFSADANDAVITITHDKLAHTELDNVFVDYELGIDYVVNSGAVLVSRATQICLSSGAIVIELPHSNSISSVHDAGIYFRLNKDSSVKIKGQYTSDVHIELEVT